MLLEIKPSNDTGIPVDRRFEVPVLPFPNANCSKLELAIAW